MSKSISTIGLILIAFSASTQTFELDSKNNIAHFLRLENSLGSERLENNTTYVSAKGVAQPILFRRKQENLPDLIISYFYYEKDSGIAHIEYDWNYGGGSKPGKNTINSFINKYKELYSQVYKKFGASSSEGDLNDLSKIETGDFRKEDTWKLNDSTVIDMFMILSAKHFKNF